MKGEDLMQLHEIAGIPLGEASTPAGRDTARAPAISTRFITASLIATISTQ
jgi:hypothetical protein